MNNMAKGELSIRVSNKNHRNPLIFDFQPMVNSKDGINLMPCCLCNVRVKAFGRKGETAHAVFEIRRS